MSVPPRLRWRCRRGTKELDMVLLRFLEQDYHRLDDDERDQFELLLAEQDPDLARWIWGGETPPARFERLIGRVQAVSAIR